MQSDTSKIETIQNIDCISIKDQNNIDVYHKVGASLYESGYTLMGNTYHPNTFKQVDSYPVPPVCYTLEEFKSLPSKYDFIHPLYKLSAIAAVCIIFYVVFAIFIKPFTRGGIG